MQPGVLPKMGTGIAELEGAIDAAVVGLAGDSRLVVCGHVGEDSINIITTIMS